MIASANFRVIMACLNNCRMASISCKLYPVVPLRVSSTIQIREEPKKMYFFDILILPDEENYDFFPALRWHGNSIQEQEIFISLVMSHEYE